MKADLIIEKARNEITDFLRYEIGLLYLNLHKQYPTFESGEDVVITNKEMIEIPIIGVWMKDNELEESVITFQKLHNIKLLLDDSIVFELEDIEGVGVMDWEFDLSDISTDDLAKIANVIQKTYEKNIKNE